MNMEDDESRVKFLGVLQKCQILPETLATFGGSILGGTAATPATIRFVSGAERRGHYGSAMRGQGATGGWQRRCPQRLTVMRTGQPRAQGERKREARGRRPLALR